MTEPAPLPITNQPYYVRRRQSWSIDNERQKHIQSIYMVGEPALFTMMWKVEDFEAGLVGRCPRCRQDPTSIQGRIEAAYQQPLNARCLSCFGTTFTGGIRAQIIRPAIFTDADEDERKSSRGVTHPESTTVESTNDFRTRTGDFVFRKDGSRWQLSAPSRVMLRTGYEEPSQQASSIGYARIPANREDETSVAFDLPPERSYLYSYLDVTSYFPESPNYQMLNGPLIPPEPQ